ncbi:hypothetical protein DACRYDRAFT_105458 [Dacryopinax primogenitus]|uniref:Methyltransferase domain-containing protein n=1 Tax=Dacryopinax primogenitus (strain DJM 731) TaxID=1858805 RepID=M5G6R8_DACPD|nr:uncharacterized protein DACRYDRAFT_105458 [Dacryopinax primogenitus]EJU04399.1 hypothetical protein DACRYDRAFT_105458 [Dacryopinax primogenitus]
MSSHSHPSTPHRPHPPPTPTSIPVIPNTVKPPDTSADLDALAPSVYRTRRPLQVRPRTTILRVPWAGGREGLPGATSGLNQEHPAPVQGLSPPGQGRARSGGSAAGSSIGRRSTDVRSAFPLGHESEDSDVDSAWGGEREREDRRWLDPRFGWKGRERHALGAIPYPVSFSDEMMDHQILTTDVIRRVKGSVSSHVFPPSPSQQPQSCLDIGCGSGSWILAAAREWPQCKFVGLDAVPVHPRLGKQLAELEGRISWVTSDFLEKELPFGEEQFDHVHCWFVSAGVPETKWFDFFENVTRVLKPGGTFEFVDEDIVFPTLTKPGSPHDSLSAAGSPSNGKGQASAAAGGAATLPGAVDALGERRPSTNTHIHNNTPPSTFSSLASLANLSQDIPRPASVSSGSLSLKQVASNGTGTGTGTGQGLVAATGAYTLTREQLLGLPEEHDHSLLEKLYNSVWQSRGINQEPTGGIQLFINTYLVDVQVTPPLVFPAQPWGVKTAKMPFYDTEGLSTLPNNALHFVSNETFLPNTTLNSQHIINIQHTNGPRQLAAVLSVKEAMWEEYRRLRANEHALAEQRALERQEISSRQAEREAEAREGRLPPSIDLMVQGGGASTAETRELIEHHQKVVSQERERDAARLAELDRADKVTLEEKLKIRSRLRGVLPDEIVVDRVQLLGPGMGEWTDVTVLLGREDTARDREVFDILMDRYERDMRYRTQHTEVMARYLHRVEPPHTHLTGDELTREETWRKGLEEYMDEGNDSEVVWRRMRTYTARKSQRRLGTERAGRVL